jgi:RND family efflux transporter MFP subunit
VRTLLVICGVLATAAVVLAVAVSPTERVPPAVAPRQPAPDSAREPSPAESAAIPPAAPVGVLLAGQSVVLSAELAGRLESSPVRVGARVAKGTLVARLDIRGSRDEARASRALVESAAAQARKAARELVERRRELEQSESLAGQGAVSREELGRTRTAVALAEGEFESARAKASELRSRSLALTRQLTAVEFRAPFDGAVAARYAEVGALVPAGAPVLRLIEDDGWFVRVALPESEASKARVGSPFLAVDPTGNLELTGRLDTVAPEIDPASRTLIVEGRVRPNRPDAFLRSGLRMDVRLLAGDGSL